MGRTTAFNKEVQTLDGLHSTSRENLILSYLTTDPLVEIDQETGDYATRWLKASSGSMIARLISPCAKACNSATDRR